MLSCVAHVRCYVVTASVNVGALVPEDVETLKLLREQAEQYQQERLNNPDDDE
jgi:hypothetical protein